MKYLFIGGCADGKEIEISSPEIYYKVKHRRQSPKISENEEIINFREDEYWRQVIVSSNVTYEVFVYRNLEGFMGRLIEGYRPQENKEYMEAMELFLDEPTDTNRRNAQRIRDSFLCEHGELPHERK